MQTMRSDLAGCPVIIGGGLAGLMTALRLAPRPVILLAKVPLSRRRGLGLGPGRHRRRRGRRRPAGPARRRHAGGRRRPQRSAPSPAASPRRRRPPSSSWSATASAFDRDAGRPPGARPGGRARPPPHRPCRRATAPGAAIMRALVAAVQATPSITVIEGWKPAACWSTTGGIAGVLAAGPADACLLPSRRGRAGDRRLGGLYAHTTNPLGAIGQGLALAARAGAALADLEFVQFHPTALDVGLDPMPLVSEALRGEGAVLVDETGARFMAGYGRGELEPRDVVARAIGGADRGRPSRLPRCPAGARRGLRQALPRHRRALPRRRHRSRAPADPGAPGGALPHGRRRRGRARAAARSPGLWACGEVAATGLHGANRLASNSLLEARGHARAPWPTDVAGTEPAQLPAAAAGAPLPPAPDRRRPCAARSDADAGRRARRARASSRAVGHLQPLAARAERGRRSGAGRA